MNKIYEALGRLEEALDELLDDETGDVSDFQAPAFRPMESLEDAPLTEVEEEAMKILLQTYHMDPDELQDFVYNEYQGADSLGPYRDAEEASETIEEAIRKAAIEVAEIMTHYDEFDQRFGNGYYENE